MDIIFIFAIGIASILFLGFLIFLKFYYKVEQGKAMIVNTLRSEPEVTFTGRMVYPIIHVKEIMEISMKTVVIRRMGNEGLICKDNIRADIEVTFFVHVNRTAEDVLKVAQTIGCERASHEETLESLFSAKFSEALKTVGKGMDFVDLYQERDRFRDAILKAIGNDLSGYVLEDAAIDYLEQTPLNKLDPNNILDAQGIRKITELTALEHVQTNNLQRDEQMQIKKKDTETQETLLELERQQAEATARQQREIASSKAREEAEAARIQAEERAKAELAKLDADQQIAVQEQNVQRETEVAENNRKRAVAVEEEKVTRARELEIVDREKEVALQEIDKERALEIQKKAIADVIRERIVVERTVAEQEEAIKEVRLVSEADRTKKALVIDAEARAQEKLTVDVKAAEADELRAKHKANEQLTMAEARLKVAEKEAEAKKREAEGIEAFNAAEGLAETKVLLAQADAKEKDGLVQVKIRLADADAVTKQGEAIAQALGMKLEAEAKGKAQLGLADVQIKAADADAVAKQGQAVADSLRLKLEAEAKGKAQLGLADVEVKAADAKAVASMGDAQAHVVEARLQAEARGLQEKFAAMNSMSEEARAHEEFRMQLDNAHLQTLKAIEANTHIAREQAEVLGKALANAKFDIVGGDGAYFERFSNALGIGKAIDGTIFKSQALQVALKDNLEGKRDTIADVQGLLGGLGQSAGELQNLSVTALLGQVMTSGTDEQKSALQSLLQSFKR